MKMMNVEKASNPPDDPRIPSHHKKVEESPRPNMTPSKYPEKPAKESKFTDEEKAILYPPVPEYKPEKPIFEPQIPTVAEIRAKMNKEAEAKERKYHGDPLNLFTDKS